MTGESTRNMFVPVQKRNRPLAVISYYLYEIAKEIRTDILKIDHLVGSACIQKVHAEPFSEGPSLEVQ